MSAWEDYLVPGTQVLKNKAGFITQAGLEEFERRMSDKGIASVRQNPIQGDYDLKHLQAIHKEVFKDTYEWAGKVRNVAVNKNTTQFTPAFEIEDKAKAIHENIKEQGYLRGMDKETFAKEMGKVYADLNKLHPFREGNGRVTRELMGQLAKEAGYEISYRGVRKDEWYIAAKESAKEEGKGRDLSGIQLIIAENTKSTRALSFERDRPIEAIKKHPELLGAYKAIEYAREHGRDHVALKDQLLDKFQEGKIVGAPVSLEDSKAVITIAAQARGLSVRDGVAVGGTQKGTVIAQSEHHIIVKMGSTVALSYEKASLDKSVNVGDKLSIEPGALQNKVLAHDAKSTAQDKSMSMAREIGGRDKR